MESKIVEAVGVSANSLWPSGKARAKLIEMAMSEAVLAASAAGITDPVKVREMMMTARQKLLQS